MKHWYEVTFLVPVIWEEALPSLLDELGFSGTWIDDEGKPPHRSLLRAYYPEKEWKPSLKEDLAGLLEHLSDVFSNGAEKGVFEVRLIEEEDWVSKWLPFFEPIKIGPVWIRPAEKVIELSQGEVDLVIDPGQAFGTGHHETTRLCLKTFFKFHKKLQWSDPVLDLGTGSGVLAMFAAKLGFDNILALDIDPTARETARSNLVVNGFDAGSGGRAQRAIQIVDEPIEKITESFSLIMANLTTRDLVTLSRAIEKRLENKGWLIASGVLETEKEDVLEAFYRNNMELVEQYLENDWICLVFRKL